MQRNERTDHLSIAVAANAALRLLHWERLEAESAGLGRDAQYIADLEDEIAEVRSAFVGAAVTEIALLRAEMAAPLLG